MGQAPPVVFRMDMIVTVASHGAGLEACQEWRSHWMDAMTVLEPVGFFSEHWTDREATCALRESLGEPHPQAEEIAAYLDCGVIYLTVPGVIADTLQPESDFKGFLHVLTDGIWAWPAYLSYYVAHHNVRLPEAFLKHMAACDFTPPEHRAVPARDELLLAVR